MRGAGGGASLGGGERAMSPGRAGARASTRHQVVEGRAPLAGSTYDAAPHADALEGLAVEDDVAHASPFAARENTAKTFSRV